jgi:hypothetical protein
MTQVTISSIARSSGASHWPEGAMDVQKPAIKPKTTRKGCGFSQLKQIVIWQAILGVRSPAWKLGDTAPFGSIRRAHDQAVAACRAAGLAPPRYRTVYTLWHRDVPSPAVISALRSEHGSK